MELLATIYSAADLSIVTSLQDNLPNVVLESLACGTPVIGFDIGGMPDMVRDDLTGYLVAPNQYKEMGEKVALMLQDHARLREMSVRATRVVLSEFGVEVQASKYSALYERVLAEFPGGKEMRRGSTERVFSFDVFDTVLTRLVASPTDVFLVVNEALSGSSLEVPRALKSNFVKHRVAAESRARRASPKEDVSLAEIYDVLSDSFELDQKQRNHVMSCEIETEAGLIEPVGSVIQAIKDVRVEGERIVFLSDMYLPSSGIRTCLSGQGLLIRVTSFVSGEVGLSKTSGNLFRHAAETLGITAGQLVHFGDNQWSDVAVPKRIGVQLNDGMRMKLAPTARERSVIRRREPRNFLSSLVAGAARTVAWLEYTEKSSRKSSGTPRRMLLGLVSLFMFIGFCRARRGLASRHFISLREMRICHSRLLSLSTREWALG